MITFLVVGRNDGYGINLHKRTAISLNYFASLCEGPDDEIIYVDCNTPERDLTLVEEVSDTLTTEARKRIRGYRITKQQMHDAIGETPLPFSDELSRNVGIRRSNPANRWLLSTNCDILIQPLSGSLHRFVEKLEPKFYVCPRVGIPAVQWQCLDRMNVGQIGEFCDEVIKGGFRLPPERPEAWLRFNSIGDFQLAPREQWFEIAGCEEGMKLWGHSDANNSRRLNLLNGGGKTPDLSDELRIIHLDHNYSASSSHEKVLIHNDWKYWVEEVQSPRSRNGENWGLAHLELPVITLTPGELDPSRILKMHRRPRTFLRSLAIRAGAAFWKKSSALANQLEKR